MSCCLVTWLPGQVSQMGCNEGPGKPGKPCFGEFPGNVVVWIAWIALDPPGILPLAHALPLYLRPPPRELLRVVLLGLACDR